MAIQEPKSQEALKHLLFAL